MWNNRPTPPTPTTRAFNRLDRVVCIRADGCPELSVGKLYVVRLYQPGVHHLTNTVSGCVTLYNVKPRDIGVECYDSSRFTLAVDDVPG